MKDLQVLVISITMIRMKILPNIIFDQVLRFFIVGSMFFYIPNMEQLKPQEMFVQYGIIVIFAVSLMVPKKRSVNNFYFGLMLLYLALHTIFYSFSIPSRMTLLNIFFGFVFIKTAAETMELNLKKSGVFFLIFAIANLTLMIFQYYGKDPIYSSLMPENMPEVDITGFMALRSHAAAMAALITPFIFAVSPWACLVLVPILIIGKSSTCLLAFIITFYFLMFFKSKKFFAWTLPIVLFAGAYYVLFQDAPSGEFNKRLYTWWSGVHVWKDSLWFGKGLGMWNVSDFIFIQENGKPQKWAWAHNEFIQLGFEAGFFSLMILYFLAKSMLKKISLTDELSRYCLAGVGALSIVSFFHFPFHIGRLAGLSMYILAFLIAKDSEYGT
jgi:hypothetical protein